MTEMERPTETIDALFAQEASEGLSRSVASLLQWIDYLEAKLASGERVVRADEVTTDHEFLFWNPSHARFEWTRVAGTTQTRSGHQFIQGIGWQFDINRDSPVCVRPLQQKPDPRRAAVLKIFPVMSEGNLDELLAAIDAVGQPS